jgi:hypothetical protein
MSELMGDQPDQQQQPQSQAPAPASPATASGFQPNGQPTVNASPSSKDSNSFSLAEMTGGQSQPSQGATIQQPTATISAVHEPTTFLGKFGRWAENVSNDLKYGTDETGIGTVLKKMGAHGVYMGNSEAVGDFMASLPLGLLKAAKGTSELAPSVIGGEKGRTWQGLKDVVGGGLQAVQIPSAFVAPEVGEVAAEGAGKAASAAGRAGSAVIDKVKPLVTDIPKATEGKLVDALGDIAEKSGFERSDTADTVVDATKHLMTSFQQRAKAAYDALDKAAPGFQELRETIANQERAVKAQSAVDPAKAKDIAEELAANKDKMGRLLTDDQQAAWKAADGDYSRFKSLEKFFVKAKNAATNLTSSDLTDVNRLKTGMKSMENASRQGTPTNILSRAFGEDAETLKGIVQKGSDMVNDKEAAKKLIHWLVPSLGLAGAGYEAIKHLP